MLTGVKVGDSVLLPDYGGQKVDLGDKDKELFLYSDQEILGVVESCLLYTSPSPRDATLSRMPSSA